MSMLGPSSVLFAYGAGSRFSNGTFQRLGSGYHWDRLGNLHLEERTDVPRLQWLDLDGDGIAETSCLLVEPAAENLVVPSEPRLADYEETDRISEAAGKYGFLRGTMFKNGGIATFRATPSVAGLHTYSFHVQRDDAAPVELYDVYVNTSGLERVGNTDNVHVEHLNRALYRVWMVVEGEKQGWFHLEASAPLTVYGHQLERGATPTTYLRTETAPTARTAEQFYFRAPQLAYPRATWTMLVRWVHRMRGDGGQPKPVFWQLGTVDMRGLCLRHGADSVELHYHSGNATDVAAVPVSTDYHDVLEAAVLWGGDGNATLIVARNGEIVGVSQFAKGLLPPVEWGGDYPDRFWLCDPRTAYQPPIGIVNALAIQGNPPGNGRAVLHQLRNTRTAIGTVV